MTIKYPYLGQFETTDDFFNEAIRTKTIINPLKIKLQGSSLTTLVYINSCIGELNEAIRNGTAQTV